MANFLKIIQNAADEIGIVQPATGINSGAVETIKLIRYADKVGNSLMKSFHWQILTNIAATGTPKVAFTIDTDVPLLNPELLTLGIIYEYLEGDGLPSVSAAKAYLDMFKLLAKNDQPSSGTLVAGDIFSGKPTGGYSKDKANLYIENFTCTHWWMGYSTRISIHAFRQCSYIR